MWKVIKFVFSILESQQDRSDTKAALTVDYILSRLDKVFFYEKQFYKCNSTTHSLPIAIDILQYSIWIKLPRLLLCTECTLAWESHERVDILQYGDSANAASLKLVTHPSPFQPPSSLC
jgi:hypothetical protein